MKNYDAILNLSRPDSRHPKMDPGSRAAQFAPFAALTGYDAVLAEIDREKTERRELDEEQRAALDDAFVLLCSLGKGTMVHVCWFEEDVYLEKTDRLRRWNETERWIQFRDGTRIRFEDLAVLEMVEDR